MAIGKESRTKARNGGLWSAITFSWLSSLMKRSLKETLTADDLYAVSNENSAQHTGDNLERQWQRELAGAHQGRRPSFMRALLKCFWKPLFILGLTTGMTEAAKIIQPILVAGMLQYFAHGDGSDATTSRTYLYAVATIGTIILMSATNQPFEFFSYVIGMRMRVGSSALIYRKTLRLSQKALSECSTGHIANLMSTDAVRFDYIPMYLHYPWLAPVEAAAAVAILWLEVGAASLPGLTLMLITMPLQVYLGKLFAKLRLKMASHTDQRLELIDQVIAGVKVIKLYCWERPFAGLIALARKHELKLVRITNYLKVVTIEIGYATFSKVAVASCVVTSIMLYGEMPALDTIVILLRLISAIQDSLVYYLPMSVQVWGELFSTCSRIQEFLLMDECDPKPVRDLDEKEAACVRLTGYTGKYGGSDSTVLRDVTVSATAGELVAILGPVGAGKSSLLMAILGELPRVSGDLTVVGRVAYAAQQPWIFSASLRQNILFGRDYDENRYRSVVEACALERDLSVLPDGDQTLVGERGVMLSGGQKARVSLARALYQDADIYLLDDPLSAVDAAVACHVFERCIKGALADRLCFLVTHQLHYARQAKYLLLVNAGSVKAVNSESDLQFINNTLNEPTTGVDETGSETSLSALLVNAHTEELLDEKSAQAQLNGSTGPCTRRSLVLSSSHPCIVAAENSSVHRESISDRQGSSDGPIETGSHVDALLPLKSADTESAEFEQAEYEAEHVEQGSVSWAIYKEYFTAGTSKIVLAMLAVFMMGGQASFVVIDWFLTERACTKLDTGGHMMQDLANDLEGMNETLQATTYINQTWGKEIRTVSNATTGNGSCTGAAAVELDYFVYIYASLTAAVVIMSIARALLFYKVCLQTSSRLHDNMVTAVLRSPMRFFDTNPVGRILNRFSSDMTYVDNFLPIYCYDLVVTLMMIGATVVMVAIANPWLLVLLVPIAAVLLYARKVYAATSRAVKRLESVTRSPVLSHVSATITGIFTIRAVKSQKMFCRAWCSIQDSHTEAHFMLLSVNRWLAIRMDAMCVAFVSCVILLCIVAKDSVGLNPNMFALAITYAVSMTVTFQYVVRQSIDVENMMTSSERIIDYSKLPVDGASEASAARQPPSGWPSEGRLEATGVSLRYYAGGPEVLRNMSFSIRGGEKVGVCGRTGAGKSSLLAVLFRLYEPSGSFAIDGVRITDVDLPSLRSRIAIIPQEPVLFIGTVRSNLDPLSEHSDGALWDVLGEVQLSAAVQSLPGGLEAAVKEAGANFSVGQRQLLCLARALLRDTKILVIDEATANVDTTTSATIQETIKTRFRSHTVLTIAHRLDSVMDSDRIMVLDGGCIREFDEPHLLLAQPDSLLTALVRRCGKDADKLCKLAKEAHDERHRAL